MELRGDSVEVEHARITERHGDILTLQSPFGAIYARVDAKTNSNGTLNPGAEVRIDGERDGKSPWDTVVARAVTVSCDSPAIASSLNLVGAMPVQIAERNAPPFAAQAAVLAAR
ncbi:MAG: hypothetical protein ACJ790_17980 [Myxococcaceae bacterium]